MKLNQYIDHTLLKPTATPKDIEDLCAEAIQHSFYAVCVNGCYAKLATSLLQNSKVKLACVIGFPLGAMSTAMKIAEAKACIEDGADEIDMVVNIGLLKAGEIEAVQEEIAGIRAGIGGKLLKVIIETCYLTEEEKFQACRAAMHAGAHYVKTSTGFGSGGASLEDVKLMKEVVEGKLKVKASGGIKDRETALKYIKAGVHRIGTSSGIAIVIQQE